MKLSSCLRLQNRRRHWTPACQSSSPARCPALNRNLADAATRPVPPIDLVPAREPHLARLRGEVPVDAGVAHAVGQRAPDGHLQRVVPSLSPRFRSLEAALAALRTVPMAATHTRIS